MSIRKTKLHFIIRKRIPYLFILVGSALLLVTFTSVASFDQQSVDEGQQIFTQQCSGCHTVGGGKLVGPDLKGITAIRDLPWLKEFIYDPEAKFNSGDALANQLLTEYNNIRMPKLGLTTAEVDSVLAYIESASGTTQPKPTPTPSTIVGNANNGRKIFTGEVALTNGGTPCIGCHSVSGVGFLDGGALGPDLTQVLTRYGDPGLNAALTTITFPSMTGIFTQQPLTPQETMDLVAFFTQTNAQPAPVGTKLGLYFGIAGGIMVLLFGILLVFWPRQRQSISDKIRAGKF